MYILNASMPRSGSELVQSLLNQHPQIKASCISPMLEYAYGALHNITTEEARSQPEEVRRERLAAFVQGGIEAYKQASLATKPESTVYADKSRGWMQYAEIVWEFAPDAKLLICERPIESVLNSFERVYQDNIGHPECAHLPIIKASRLRYWAENLPISLAYARLQARLESNPNDPRIIRISYDQLVSAPVATMNMVFESCGLTSFTIDINNIIKAEEEVEGVFGIFGNHDVKPVITKPTL